MNAGPQTQYAPSAAAANGNGNASSGHVAQQPSTASDPVARSQSASPLAHLPVTPPSSSGPVGRAWIALRDWQADGPGCTSIKVGDRGRILRGPDKNNWIEVGLCNEDAKKRSKGWVPLKYVNIGKGMFGKPTYRVKFVTVVECRIEPPSSKTLETVFARTVKGLMLAFRDQQVALSWMRPDVLDLLKDGKQSQAFFDAFLKGIDNAGLYGVLSKVDFTFQDLLKAGQTVTVNDHRKGIYLRLYWKWNGKAYKPCGYGGQTRDIKGFATRDYRHDQACDKEDVGSSPHYNIAKFADPEGRKMIRFCILDEKMPSSWFYLAEQLEITMLTLYHEALQLRADAIQVQAKPFGVEGPDTGETPVASVNADAENATGAYEAARLLRQLASKVFEKTGWTGGFGRTSFGAWQGLNWDSPLGDSKDIGKVPWTLIENSEMEIYSRRPITAARNSNSSRSCQVSIIGGNGRHFAVTWKVDAQHGPQLGQFVWPFVEITKSGKPHPKQFARLPEVGPYQDQPEAGQLAIRVVWRDGEKWLSRYVQATIIWAGNKASEQGVSKIRDPPFQRYASVLALKHHLQRTPVDVGGVPEDIARDHTLDYGLANVRKQSFDFLSQVYLLEEMPVGPTKKVGQRTSIANSTNRMQQLGLDRVGVPWPTRDQLVKWRLSGVANNVRITCDGCKNRRTSGGKHVCTRVDNTNQCISCSQLNIPCSWSAIDKFNPGNAAYQYYGSPEILAETVKDEGTDAGISCTEVP